MEPSGREILGINREDEWLIDTHAEFKGATDGKADALADMQWAYAKVLGMSDITTNFPLYSAYMFYYALETGWMKAKQFYEDKPGLDTLDKLMGDNSNPKP